MKKQWIGAVAMVVVSAVCMGMVRVAHPIPTYAPPVDDTPVVMTVNGEPVRASEFAAYFLSVKSSYESQYAMFGMDTSGLFADAESQQMLRDEAQSSVTQYRLIVQKFKEHGMTLDKKMLDHIEASMQADLEAFGGDPALLRTAMAQQGLSPEMYQGSITVSAYANMLDDYYFGPSGVRAPSEEEIQTYYEENFLHAKHILIGTSDQEAGRMLTGDALAEKRAKLDEVLARVEAGEDFDQLIAEYGEDEGMTYQPDGYTFTDGEMVETFYQGTKALEIGQISGVVESEFGWHIIKREALPPISNEYRTRISAQLGGDFSTLLQEWIDEAQVETVDEEMQKITIDNAFALADPTGETYRNPAEAEQTPADSAEPDTQDSGTEGS